MKRMKERFFIDCIKPPGIENVQGKSTSETTLLLAKIKPVENNSLARVERYSIDY